MVLANIGGQPLTDPAFAPIWAAIDAKALPVLVHPTAPPGVGEMDMQRFQLTASLGFTFDTSLAIARMIYDGFFDRYTKLKIIAAHGGGALPYLISRMDQCYDNIPGCREKLAVRPSEVVPRIYADAVVFAPEVLALCIKVFGADNVMYGSDYPHTIGDLPGCLRRVNALPETARDKVRGRTAQRVFGYIDVEPNLAVHCDPTTSSRPLRRKYANAKGGDIFDPAFAAVAATVFADADKRKWPFAGVASFLGAPIVTPGPRARAGPASSATSMSRWSACRWILASPIAPARDSAHARCALSSASDPMSTCSRSRRWAP